MHGPEREAQIFEYTRGNAGAMEKGRNLAVFSSKKQCLILMLYPQEKIKIENAQI